jgi:MinD-like ATPase involved in chromosome partitioning or flagellar assembly
MKTINILLDTNDLDYSTAFSKSLLLYSKFFSIQISNPQLTQNEGYEWDIYLTDDMNSTAQKIVFMTEEPALATSDEENSLYIIYKYQHIGQIANLLRLAHCNYSKTEMLSDETEHSNIIGVCSSSGGSGCTSVALGICQELTRFYGKKTLYISMEEFESTGIHFPNSGDKTNNITRFIYGMIHKDNSRSRTPLGYMIHDDYGVYAFHPASGRNPLRELNESEFIQFINRITAEKFFTDLIIDCGNGLDNSIVSALQLSSRIFHVTGKIPSIQRKENYLRTLENRLGTKAMTDITKVINFYGSDEVDEMESMVEAKSTELTIEEDFSSFEDLNGHKIISLDKMFGQGIRDLVQHVILPYK